MPIDTKDDDLDFDLDRMEEKPEPDAAPPPDEDDEYSPEWTARAKRMGYIGEEDWDDERAEKEGRRKPKVFLSPKRFVLNAEDSLPMLRSQLRNLDAKLADQTKQTTEMYDILQEQRRLNVEAIERARREEREKLEREREQAVAEGDTAAFKDVQGKLDAMDKTPPPSKPAQQQAGEDPDIVAFKAANATWFTVDARLTNNMIDEFADVKGEMPAASMREQLAEAKRRLQDRFPEKFGINKRRDGAKSSVTSPTGSREAGSVERRFAALKPDEQAVYARMSKVVAERGGKMSKEEWLNEIGR